jgi:hypothetical protein
MGYVFRKIVPILMCEIFQGYDEDVSNDDDDYEWLQHLNMKRENLPNFWLITKVEPETVTTYFHCRFTIVNVNFVVTRS